MGMYSLQEENSVETLIECLGLAKAHYEEVEEKSSSLGFSFDVDAYKSFIELGMLSTVVAREDGKAVGYFCNLITKDMITSLPSASELGIYLDPSVRGTSLFYKLVKKTQEVLKKKGVVQHLIMFKAGHDKGLAEKLGYSHTETVYMKLLGD
jgi:hypothetical protein